MMQIIDLHCDTLLSLHFGGHLNSSDERHISTQKLIKGGALAQCFAIFIPTYEASEEYGVNLPPKEYFDSAYKKYLEELELEKDSIAPAFSTTDIKLNSSKGLISSVLTLEDAVIFDGNIENIDMCYKKGIRMATLTWNYENSLGYPNSRDYKAHSLGLKTFGIECVKHMNDIGMAIDVSHLSEGGFWDVAKHSSKPLIASHSCARSLCDNPRNLTDEQLKAIGDSGGIVGINFYSDFLNNRGDNISTCEDIINHMKYIASKSGIDSIGLGSDFDGIDSELEWKDYSGYPLLIDRLNTVFSSDEIDKITNQNVMRAFHDTID